MNGIDDLEKWHFVKNTDIRDRIMLRIVKSFGGSLLKMLYTHYPKYPWKPWLTRSVPAGFWSQLQNQRNFFDWFANELSFESMDKWYDVEKDAVKKPGGTTVIETHYQDSLINALTTIYPEYEWHLWRFKTVPQNFWHDVKNVREFFNWMYTKFELKSLDDWYGVSVKEVELYGGKYFLSIYGGMWQALSIVYPHHKWNPKLFMNTRKTQQYLFKLVKILFPGNNTFIDVN